MFYFISVVSGRGEGNQENPCVAFIEKDLFNLILVDDSVHA